MSPELLILVIAIGVLGGLLLYRYFGFIFLTLLATLVAMWLVAGGGKL